MQLPILSPAARPWWIMLALLAGGYILGTWLNRQRSKTLGLWLQAGLGVLGGETRWKWVGSVSSGAQVTITGANRPFRQAEILYALLTRELLPLWGLELLRGKRDLLSLRADLRSQPAREFEVVPMRGSLRATLDSSAGELPWHWQEMPAGLGLATRGEADAKLVARVRLFLDQYGAYVERLSLRQRNPNLILFIRMTGLERRPAREFLASVRRLMEESSKAQPQARGQTATSEGAV
jgi:hypothetical protein